jgi:2-polyprenyl-3-methyl-5-hydroxy-6-metoxy-1,4-benzoquinol methylase
VMESVQIIDKDVADREANFHDHRYKVISEDQHALAWSLREAELTVSTYKSPLCYEEIRSPLAAERAMNFIGNPAGKRVLVYGGGVDCSSLWFASHGADTTVIDISAEAIRIQEVLAQHARVQLKVRVADAQETDFDDKSFDIIFGRAILHHLDTEQTARELCRILAPEGVAVFRDVMKGAWGINLFRRFTPSVRTSDEHPLTKQDFEIFAKYFGDVDVHSYGYTGIILMGAVKTYNHIARKLFSSKSRLRHTLRIPVSAMHFFERQDERIFSLLPSLKFRAWLCLAIFRH